MLIKMSKLLVYFSVVILICDVITIQSQSTGIENILLIIVDDLRPELGVYTGLRDELYSGIQTPNIDALAGNSLVFINAYTQYALCSPSRSSLLTGRRPDSTKVFSNDGYWRELGGNFTTMPQYFKENGFVTYASGKLYHPDLQIDDDNDFSWSEENYRPTTDSFWHRDGLSWGIAEPEIYNIIPLPCMQIRDYAIEKIQEVASRDDPFLIAIGFEKPHLPFLAPREFFELYREEDITLPENPHVPENYPEVAWSDWCDLTFYEDTQDYNASYNSSLPPNKTIDLRLAYYASVSYTDYLVGQVLQELSSQGLENSTAVLFMSDHGYHLGELSEWSKCSNLQLDTWVPMMLKVPGVTNQGRYTSAMIENIDVFATLVDLVGLPSIEQCPDNATDILVCTEGYSMIDLLDSEPLTWKSATFSQYLNDNEMGYVIRNLEYVYIRWLVYDEDSIQWDQVTAEELYDLVADPDQLENVAGYPEFADIQAEMYEKLRAGWREALPNN